MQMSDYSVFNVKATAPKRGINPTRISLPLLKEWSLWQDFAPLRWSGVQVKATKVSNLNALTLG